MKFSARIAKFAGRRLRRAALPAVAAAMLMSTGHAGATVAEERFLQARDAYKAGERVRLGRLSEALADHELRPWVDYWRLRLRLEDGGAEGVAEFLEAEKGSYLAEKLRGEWLRFLGKRRDWAAFERELPQLVMPETDISCYALQARLARADGAGRDVVLAEARPLWFAAAELPEACAPLTDALAAAGRLEADDVWERVRRLLETKKLREARAAARYLPAAQIPDARTLEAIADKPAAHLARHRGNLATRLNREMALFAVQRMARQDPLPAATQWQEIESRFSEADRGYAWAQLGQQAAMRHLPEAPLWFDRAGTTPLSEDQLAWKTRAALRAGDWARVRLAVEQMPPQMAAEPAWTYWHARALAAQGSREQAAALFQKIAGQPNFYGNLADEELGRSISVPPRAAPPSREELAAAAARPGFRRALALIALDMRIEGVREWVWTLRGLDDRQLLAAAEVARRSEIWDRAINTADRTAAQHDYSLRYLAPYRERVEPKARELELDHGWVYGLMRQESRFIQRAKSSVGAQGLMQVMPATASWVAKKIGMSNYHPGKVTDMDINVTLGTNYLKMVLASLDNHPVLASAAYNAGPGRAKRWRADRPLEGAIYAETIPFTETRDYVKKVMSNAVYYATLFEDRPQSLKSRLGVVQPARAGDTRAEELP
jgi:soluble lytic murein transglycosylase